jgi:hypothetical protein
MNQPDNDWWDTKVQLGNERYLMKNSQVVLSWFWQTERLFLFYVGDIHKVQSVFQPLLLYSFILPNVFVAFHK